MPPPAISARQISAALALLGQTAAEFARSHAISEMEIAAAEMGAADEGQVRAVRIAMEEAGIEFLDGGSPGVRLRAITESLTPEELNASNDG